MELVSLASNPIPSGGVVGAFEGYDGAPLRYARFEATRGPLRGTMCVFTGRTEYIEKYFEVIADLRRRGFAAVIMDWRGQGGSYRALKDLGKGHIHSFDEYINDLTCFMRQIVLPDCPPPFYALAHSMGGNILLRVAAAPGSWFERMVMTSPLIALHHSQLGAPPAAVRAFAELACASGLATQYIPSGGMERWRGPPEFERNILTSDRERYALNRSLELAAPQLTVGAPTLGWLRAALRSMAELADPAFARKVGIPILFFIASDDTVVQQAAIEDFAARAKSSTHVVLAAARHEILQETDEIRGRFWAAFDAYMDVDQES